MAAAAAPAPLQISQVPVTITLPAHPQILLARRQLAIHGRRPERRDLHRLRRTDPASAAVHVELPGEFHHPGRLRRRRSTPARAASRPITAVNSAGTAARQLSQPLERRQGGHHGDFERAFIASADFGLMDYQTR